MKLQKLEQFNKNPNEAWEQIQVIRTKINEIISVINEEEEISGTSPDEEIEVLQQELMVVVGSGDYAKAAELSSKLNKLQGS